MQNTVALRCVTHTFNKCQPHYTEHQVALTQASALYTFCHEGPRLGWYIALVSFQAVQYVNQH